MLGDIIFSCELRICNGRTAQIIIVLKNYIVIHIYFKTTIFQYSHLSLKSKKEKWFFPQR